MGDPPLLVARVPNHHPLIWTGQMMPVLPVTSVPDVERGIELAEQADTDLDTQPGPRNRRSLQ